MFHARDDDPHGFRQIPWEEEKIVHTTVGNLPEDMEREGIDKTALIIVGNVLGEEYQKSKLYDASFTTGYRKAIQKQG